MRIIELQQIFAQESRVAFENAYIIAQKEFEKEINRQKSERAQAKAKLRIDQLNRSESRKQLINKELKNENAISKPRIDIRI